MDFFNAFFCDDSQAQQWLADDRLLGLIRFGATTPLPASDQRCYQIPILVLGNTVCNEVWISTQPIQRGVTDEIHHAADGNILLLQYQLHETGPEALHALTRFAYQQLLAAAHRLGYPHFLRIWNYFPEINRHYAGLERYRAFCAGRHEVLAVTTDTFETQLPAGSALGTQGAGLYIYGLAARQPGKQIENPRQISAFHYPLQYGARSPSFSRAVLKRWGADCKHLYISGTASIVGHASQHHTLASQLAETLANLKALLAEAQRQADTPLKMVLLKIYVRPLIDPLPLHKLISQVFGEQVLMLFLQADICRQELLIEIEGLASSAMSPLLQDKLS